MKYTVKIGERAFTVEIGDLDDRPIHVLVDGEPLEVWPEQATERETDKRMKTEAAQPSAAPTPVRAETPPTPAVQSPASNAVLAPIPGVIVAIAVQDNDQVEAGQELCVLEAMKMKSPIRAPRAGRIAAVRVAAGQQVKHKDVLVEYAD
jgi:biotin carboxyl carrier protein